MTSRLQALILPLVALLLVGGVLGVQLAHGGGTFEPLHPADPCAAREVTSRSTGIENLTERLVLIGLDEAACRLGTSREALTLELAQPGERTDAQIDANITNICRCGTYERLRRAIHRAADLIKA